MNAETIKPFVQYTISLFKEMYKFTPNYEKAYIVKNLEAHNWDISGVVGIMGALEGVFTIRLKRVLAFKLLNQSKISTDSPEEIIEMISDMVAEYANVICGNAINRIAGEKVELTVPFTVQGVDHTISWPAKGNIIAIPFNTPHGMFEVQLNFS